jgi:predicted nucleotidyltransferase component of viral defense system
MEPHRKRSSVFRLLSDLFAEVGMRTVLAGGYAVNAHKFSRQTFDIDFVVQSRDAGRLADALGDAGFTALTGNPTFARYRSPTPFERIVDFLFVDDTTFAAMEADSGEQSIAGQPFRVVSLEHLIAMKLHALKFGDETRHARDLLDVVELARVNGLDTASAAFRTLCLKYGTSELYERVRILSGPRSST